VRYFLDTEFNGFGGGLLSLALVPEDGTEFYATLACDEDMLPWVERNVVPYPRVPAAPPPQPSSRIISLSILRR
jgi:hypothetical protein